MKEIKRLKFSESHKFKKKANEEQFKFNQKLIKTLDSAKSAAENPQLEKVKTSLGESETLISERQKHILLADKSDYGWVTVDKKKKHSLADDSEADFVRVFSDVFSCHCSKQLQQQLLQRNRRFQDALTQSFQVSTYHDLTSLFPSRWQFLMWQLTLAPSLVDSWCSLRSIVYLRFHRFQNWPSNVEKKRCLRVGSSTSVSSPSAVATSSGMDRTLLPVNRWEGVRGSSVSSEDTYVSGLEFSTHSTSITAVESSS